MVFRVPQYGEAKEKVVTCGTVVLVNLAGNKLICVARFDKEVKLNWASRVLTLG